ncbi:MAG: PIG-L deacetylase family protein [Nitriliruptorales bacterium]|nr:PIG-L deacetylase family protein [Nitriliruptorales bacterium]
MTDDLGVPVGPGTSVLAVCAHPDDESFGLGALIDAMVQRGASTHLACLTRGAASTLGSGSGIDLAAIRSQELECAAEVLGISSVTVLDHPDGALRDVPEGRLLADVADVADRTQPEVLLVFDPGGVTGHPDHQCATEVARKVAPDLAILAWVLPEDVARTLNDEFGATFMGRPATAIDRVVAVDRRRQWRAIACHRSQEQDNPVLRRRLQLLGDYEYVSRLDTSGPCGQKKAGLDEVPLHGSPGGAE